MNFDRNTIIGFVLLAVLFFGFFYFNNKQQAAAEKEKARVDSIAKANRPIQDPVAARKDSLAGDSAHYSGDTALYQATHGVEALNVVDLGKLRVTFSNKGGQPKMVELKDFRGPDSLPVKLASSTFDKIDYRVATGNNRSEYVAQIFFQGGEPIKNADGSETIRYTYRNETGATIVHEFVVKPDNYMVDFNIHLQGLNTLLSNNTLDLIWQNKAQKLQKDISYERQQSKIGYRVNQDYDYSSALSSNSEEFKKSVNWVSVKQQFFNTTLVAKNNFTSGSIAWTAPPSTDKTTVVQATANMKIQLAAGANADVPLGIYYGPTDYKVLKTYGNEMENMVDLGSGIFSFVKYLNRWIIIPIFNFFSSLTSNFGIVILLLTLFIRLVISPLTYTSYLSGAKMKVLRPEIDQLKVKYGSDQQQISMEQMKLFREAGVNPLGGCIPALLQIPIFFALYSFFNSNVALRGQHFLWSKDLSQYDSIVNLGFSIPFYGDHVSLFTITAVLTSFLISMYSMSMTPDQGNPVLKYMPYFFPFILLFVFNKLPSGLTWYYTVSNIITLVLQYVIQNYIINHDKILARIEVNRKKPKTKSKWATRLEEMQEQQKQVKGGSNTNQNKTRR